MQLLTKEPEAKKNPSPLNTGKESLTILFDSLETLFLNES
jgi:hypothetical protein